MPGPNVPAGYESLTVAAASTPLASVPSAADHAVCTLETGQIRFRIDGGVPSATEGHLLEIGAQLRLEGKTELNQFRGFRTGGTSGVLKVSYGIY